MQASLHSRSMNQGQGPALTIIEVTAQLMIGAALHHLGHMLCLLVDRHGTDDGAWWGWRGHFDLDGTCLGNLAVEFLQERGVLEQKGEC